MLSLDVPKPNRYLKHSAVEVLASACNQYYRGLQHERASYAVDVAAFADLDLEITIVQDEIEEPELTTVFAKCAIHKEKGHIITINTLYRELFKARPDLLRSSLGHEIGHYVLRHHEWRTRPENVGLLFEDMEPKTRYLHDSSWKPLAFTKQDMNEWCRRAFSGDEEAREKLNKLQDRMEPDWMFWQAEHFSMCFLIARDQLLQCLNEGCEITSWFAIRRLADKFGVSPSMMRVRLTKIGAISIEDGKPVVGPMLKQPSMIR